MSIKPEAICLQLAQEADPAPGADLPEAQGLVGVEDHEADGEDAGELGPRVPKEDLTNI